MESPPTDLRYPLGPHQRRNHLSADERTTLIDQIAAMPARMREAVAGLNEAQLDTPYRQGGWTVRQVIHHVPDSHLNAYIRLKLALTEEHPTIKPYDEARWAELADSRDTDTAVSLALLESLHTRWTTLLRSLREEDFQRSFQHPDDEDPFTLDGLIAMYSWHGRHHVAHITTLRERMGW